MNPQATWGGFVKWAIDGEIITKEALWAMSPRARMDFTDAHYPHYVESLMSPIVRRPFFLDSEWGHFVNRMSGL